MDGIEFRTVELIVDDEPVEVRYLAGGTGPPMVFLHGIGLDAATVSWRYALPDLAEDYRVYAPNLPGHGESDTPDRTYTNEYYVNTLAAFRERIGIESETLVGLSMGGAVALGDTLSGGDAERLVLVDSYGLGRDAYWRGPASVGIRLPFARQLLWGSVGTRPMIRSTLRQLADAEGPPADLVDDVQRVTTPETVRTLRRWQRHEFRADGLRTDYSDRLDDVGIPTLLIHGQKIRCFRSRGRDERARHFRTRNFGYSRSVVTGPHVNGPNSSTAWSARSSPQAVRRSGRPLRRR